MDWTWSLETLFRALGKSPAGPLPPVSITSVRLEADKCRPGALYVPVRQFELPSQEADAIVQAARNGASAAFTSLRELPDRAPIPVLHAGPTMDVLVTLARMARSEYRGKVVAITGSVGKSTTKDLTHHLLSHAGPTHKMVGNFNVLSGVCSALINRPLASRFAVMEIAASRPGHLMKAKLVRPHIGVVTNVGVSHLQHYGAPRDLFREKLSLFDHLDGERIGIVHRSVLAADDAGERLIRAKGLSRLIVVGNTTDDDVHLADVVFDGMATEGTMSVFGRRHRFRLNFPARHFAENAMFAMAVAGALDLDVESLMPALASAPTTPRRFQRHHVAVAGGTIELIDDAYNAAPSSVEAMLDSFGQRTAARKVLVFGDMLGIGSDSPRLHHEVGAQIASAGVSLLVTVGELARLAAPGNVETVHVDDAASAAAALPGLLRAGDLVAIKGSHDVGLKAVVTAVLAMEGADSEIPRRTAPTNVASASPLAAGGDGPPPPSRMLVDPTNGRILFEEHADILRHPASLTKLMLLNLIFAQLAAGRLRLTDTFQMTPAGARSRGSRLGCPPGTTLSVEQAVAALAVASANDVAISIAESLAGSVTATVRAMNEMAGAMGLRATQFATPHGLDAPGQVTSARDMARLAVRTYMSFPDRRHFFGRRSLEFQGIALPNRNTLLPVYAGMNGMKTGTTPRAGCHLVGSAERGGRHLIAIVMGCPTKTMRNQATAALLDHGFNRGVDAASGTARTA